METKKHNLRWFWGLGGVIVAAIIVVIIIVVVNNSNKGGGTQEVASEITTDIGETTSAENTTGNTELEKEEVQQYSGDDPNTSESITGVISYAGLNDDNLVIRVNIDQYLTNGSCKIEITKDGNKVYEETAKIEASVATATCSGFTIPLNKLSTGDMEVKINLESDGKSGTMVGEITI